MSGHISRLLIAPIFISSLALFGCSSGGGGSAGGATGITYSGATSPAAITSTNAEALGTSSGEAVQKGFESNSSNVFGIEITSSSSIDIEALSVSLANMAASADALNLPSAYTEAGSCGGSVTIPDSQLAAFGAVSGPVAFTMTFVDYCDATVGAQYTISGTVNFSYDDIGIPNSGFSIQYVGVTVSDGSQTATVNMTVDCSDASDPMSCIIASDYMSADGGVHRISDISITGDAVTGFNGTATLYHETHGSVSITATNVTFGSCGDYPDGGSVSVTAGGGSSASATFNPDCSYVIDWDDGVTNGTINGSF